MTEVALAVFAASVAVLHVVGCWTAYRLGVSRTALGRRPPVIVRTDAAHYSFLFSETCTYYLIWNHVQGKAYDGRTKAGEWARMYGRSDLGWIPTKDADKIRKAML